MLKLVTTCAVALIAFTGCTLNFNVPETKQADSMPTHAERQSVSPEPAPIDEMKGHICAGILDQFDRISASNFTSEAMAAAYREMARLVSTDPRIAECRSTSTRPRSNRETTMRTQMTPSQNSRFTAQTRRRPEPRKGSRTHGKRTHPGSVDSQQGRGVYLGGG